MLSCDRIREKSGASIFGNNIFCLSEVDSTNTFILNMARSQAPEGTVVVADFQHSGRGRLGKRWFSPSGKNLIFSVLMRPAVEIEYAQRITLGIADTIALSIEEFFSQLDINLPRVTVKWPNDLLLEGKKVCGILMESILKDKFITALAIGIGINLNILEEDFPEDLSGKATSLMHYSKKILVAEDLLAIILRNLEQDYERWERNNYREVASRWKKRCEQMGQPITVVQGDQREEAVFEDVDPTGYLIYRKKDGSQKQLISGEIECC